MLEEVVLEFVVDSAANPNPYKRSDSHVIRGTSRDNADTNIRAVYQRSRLKISQKSLPILGYDKKDP